MLKLILIAVSALFLSTALNAETKVLAFAGSTRTDSANKKLVKEAADLARQMGATVTVIDLRDYPIPFYDGDLEAEEGMPANAQFIRQSMAESQAIFIASPDYSHSVSAVLKNVLDWTSRREDGAPKVLKGKKIAIMSASPGSKGGVKGLIHLRSILEDMGGTVLPEEVCIPNAYEAFDEQGRLKDSRLKEKLQQLVQKAIN